MSVGDLFTRRKRAAVATAAMSALAVTGLVHEPAAVAAAPSRTPALERPVEKPNLLMVTVDDLSYLDMDYLPQVRKLVERSGVSFSDAIAPTPICVPARASLLTGQYAHNHGARTIEGPHGGYGAFDDSSTLATSLQDAGYSTIMSGKYLNGYGEGETRGDVPPGWDQWRATVDPSTYNFRSPKFNVNGEVIKSKGYSSDVITQHAKAGIAAERGSGKPWFSWVNYVAPHHGGPSGPDDPKKLYPGTDAALSVTVPAKRDRGTYDNLPIPSRPNLFPDDVSGYAKGSPARGKFSDLKKKALRIAYQRRIEAVRGLDRTISSLLGDLRKSGDLKRTMVVFTSDNGYSAGYHNLNGKLWHYDESLRIPVLMSGPGIPRGRTVRTPVTNPDIAATLLAAAGAKAPRPLDGVDIMPWLRAPEQVRVIPIGGWRVTDGNRKLWTGIRAGSWTYARLHNGQVEVYDRSSDPYEQHNLARVPALAGTVEALARLSERYADCAGSTCPRDMYAAGGALDLERL
ncbi:arylsulfatase A-like enzyme [Nocardioides albertanoniae]|uniref:Arylsulfatase A-like enzyme n=1 Tax=Nocardioides albertanoniae TaxID=1175486 RepID=A0A543AC08_9ACTN|nr:sulfatase-like hydrolase/transferase [Nocardioides albertanoniae]TQL70133.1 arylsulfatase A-like enzyme [Nocardioides albertanoniae]